MNAKLAQHAAAPRFIKIGEDGAELPANATGHAAVRDTSTGLLHAVGVCPRQVKPEEAKALVEKLNAAKYAGVDTWRVPDRHESFSIVKPGVHAPAADTDFFPDMCSDWYWTCEGHPYFTASAFAIHFTYGDISDLGRAYMAFCRPVASVPAGA